MPMVAAPTPEQFAAMQQALAEALKRNEVLAGELRRLGVTIDEHEDGFALEGPQRLRGTGVDSNDDHRLGMALAVAGLAADGVTLVDDASCMADSFPSFVETMQQLGASIEWVAAS